MTTAIIILIVIVVLINGRAFFNLLGILLAAALWLLPVAGVLLAGAYLFGVFN